MSMYIGGKKIIFRVRMMMMMMMMMLIRQTEYAKYSITRMSFVKLTQLNKEAVIFLQSGLSVTNFSVLKYIGYGMYHLPQHFQLCGFPFRRCLCFGAFLELTGIFP